MSDIYVEVLPAFAITQTARQRLVEAATAFIETGGDGLTILSQVFDTDEWREWAADSLAAKLADTVCEACDIDRDDTEHQRLRSLGLMDVWVLPSAGETSSVGVTAMLLQNISPVWDAMQRLACESRQQQAAARVADAPAVSRTVTLSVIEIYVREVVWPVPADASDASDAVVAAMAIQSFDATGAAPTLGEQAAAILSEQDTEHGLSCEMVPELTESLASLGYRLGEGAYIPGIAAVTVTSAEAQTVTSFSDDL